MFFRLQKATTRNYKTLAALGRDTFTENFAESNDPEDFSDYITKAFYPYKILIDLEQPDSQFYIVWHEKKAIAYCRINFDTELDELIGKKQIEVQQIYVKKAFKGHGIGTILMEKVIQLAQHGKYDAIWLGVWEHNPAAIAFYEHKGFRRIGQHIFQLGKDAQIDYLYALEVGTDK
jgi:diamine N-acetyltransferase